MTAQTSNESELAATPGASFLDRVILALLLAFPSTGFIQKYTGLAGVAGYILLVGTMVYLVSHFGARFAPALRSHYRALSLLSISGLVLGFALLHPLEDSRGLGKSSDRDDGLNMAASRMAHGESPYYPPHKSIGPLSVLPGSVILAAPFVAMGNSGYQNIFWLAVFLTACCVNFRDKALALLMLLGPLAISPAALYEFVSGGDMLANGIYVAVFFLITLRSWTKPATCEWVKWGTCILLSIGLASRSNFLLLTPLFGATLWRTVGFRHALVASSFVVLVAAAITIPFYLHDPAGFTPLLAKQKMAIVDHSLPWASAAMIGTTALVGLFGAVALLLTSSADLNRSFFRWCAVVTLWPMISAVALFSLVNGHLDFGFMRDRFGLMYVFFALLGWGGQLLQGLQSSDKSSLS